MRYDLTFFLCCCKSFLGSDNAEDGTDFYGLLGVERDATPDEIKRAYRRQSLQMHPDKLAQRGKAVTEQEQAKFTRMKEAYEVLSDPHKRETYDAIGERGMKWLEEPFSIDPQELAHNFATSSVLDRSKIFSIFVGIAVAVLILPVLVCLHVDGAFGPNAPWMATLVPLWIWDGFILFYHSRVIMMGPIARPDHIPPEEWVDPLPMKKRLFSLARFLLIVLFELLVALRLDGVIWCDWAFVFVPLFAWEATTLYKKWPMARMRIVTIQDLETALDKSFSQFTQAEKELIGKRYTVVPSTTSPEYEAAQKLKSRARHDMVKCCFRIIFIVVLVAQLEDRLSWSWWLVFLPFWVMTFLICFSNYQSFAEVQQMAAEKDPTLFGLQEGGNSPAQSNYGSVGNDGTATTEAASTAVPPSNLTEEEREELKAQVMASGSRLCSKCCSQGFLLILVFLFVGKLQGAGFSSLWIISPFLLTAGIILCCLGCAIFGITEVGDGFDFNEENVEYDTGKGGNGVETPATTSVPMGSNYNPPETKDNATASTDPEVGGAAAAATAQQQLSASNPVPVTEPVVVADDNPSSTTAKANSPEAASAAIPPSFSSPIDLLDDEQNSDPSGSNKPVTRQATDSQDGDITGAIDDLD